MNQIEQLELHIKDQQEQLQIHEFGFVDVKDIVISQEVRDLCAANACGLYGKTWACPPGVGEVKDCKAKILSYNHIFVYTTKHLLEDSFDYEGMVEGKEKHEADCPPIAKIFKEQYKDCLVLSAEGCSKCEKCTYPDAPCRFPETMYPSIESYGVQVNKLAESAKINYINGVNTVTYFGCILF